MNEDRGERVKGRFGDSETEFRFDERDEDIAVKSGQAFDCDENQEAGAIIGIVEVRDSDEVKEGEVYFAFYNDGVPSNVSSDGYFQIDNNGVITITEAGAAAGAATNDYETGLNSYAYEIVTTDDDDGEKWNKPVSVELNVGDVGPVAYDAIFTTVYDQSLIDAVPEATGTGVTYTVLYAFTSGTVQFPFDGLASITTATEIGTWTTDFENVASNPDAILFVDTSVEDQLTIGATGNYPLDTVTGSTFTGFTLLGLSRTGPWQLTSTTDNLTSYLNTSNQNPLTFPVFAYSSSLNIWNFSNDPVASFNVLEPAFAGSSTWTVNAEDYGAISNLDALLTFNHDGTFTFDPENNFTDVQAGVERAFGFYYFATDAQRENSEVQ